MIQGFLFGMGFFAAITVTVLIFVLLAKLKVRRPTVHMWNEYKKKAIENGQYEEAAFVAQLIEGKDDDVRTPLPKGYKIEKKSRTVLNDGGGDEVSVRVDKEYWIVKVKPRK